MAGAGTAAPLDATGALHWNPGSITGLPRSELDLSLEFLWPQTEVSSSIPAFGWEGSTISDSGTTVLPNVALVYHDENSPWSYGLGLQTIGGFSVNYPASTTNPILNPTLGLGTIYSYLGLMQLAPTIAVQCTDHVSVGFAPTVTIADLAVDPLFLADQIGPGAYPSGTHTRIHWGLGFQAGLYLTTEECWKFGVSYKSPQWFETFTFYSQDALGAPREFNLGIEYPSIISAGVAYEGIDRWLFALDLRYIDYENCQIFGDPASVSPTGAVTGLGWRSVTYVALGGQYQWSDRCQLRAGYSYNTNPIPDEATSLNVASSVIYQHALYCGLSRQLTSNMTLSLSYYHTFDNAIRGPYLAPLPGSSTTIRQDVDALTAGIQVAF
jgi:long-chain fatty acid transport protein